MGHYVSEKEGFWLQFPCGPTVDKELHTDHRIAKIKFKYTRYEPTIRCLTDHRSIHLATTTLVRVSRLNQLSFLSSTGPFTLSLKLSRSFGKVQKSSAIQDRLLVKYRNESRLFVSFRTFIPRESKSRGAQCQCC